MLTQVPTEDMKYSYFWEHSIKPNLLQVAKKEIHFIGVLDQVKFIDI